MRINIPTKLEKHKEMIKQFSEHLIYAQKLSLIRVGGSQKTNQYKEIYLCYNPYNTAIKLDINHFEKNKNIYKMYPPSIVIPSKEVFAFLVFASENSKLAIDEDYLLFHKKQRIDQLITKITDKNQNQDLDIIIEEYNPDVNSTLLIDDLKLPVNKEIKNYDLDKTQYLDNFDPEKVKKEFDYINSENDNIVVNLHKLEYNQLSKKYRIIVEFTNKSEDENYEISGFTINLYDKEHKHGYQIGKIIKLKQLSKKKVSFSLDKDVFEEFVIQDLKIKVSF